MKRIGKLIKTKSWKLSNNPGEQVMTKVARNTCQTCVQDLGSEMLYKALR